MRDHHSLGFICGPRCENYFGKGFKISFNIFIGFSKFVLKLARYLVNAGIEKGDWIAVYMNNSWQSVISLYGITLAGGVFLIINPQIKALQPKLKISSIK